MFHALSFVRRYPVLVHDANGTELMELRDGKALFCQFSSDGSRLVVAGHSSCVVVYDTSSTTWAVCASTPKEQAPTDSPTIDVSLTRVAYHTGKPQSVVVRNLINGEVQRFAGINATSS